MSSCPFCRANLSDVDLQSERCSSCGRALVFDEQGALRAAPNGSSPQDVTLDSTPDEATGDTADEDRIGETLDAARLQEEEAGEEKSTADERRFAETVDPSRVPDESSEKEEKGTADERRIAETLDPKAVPQPPPAKDDDEKSTAADGDFAATLQPGALPESPGPEDDTGTADSRRIAATYDTGGLSQDAVERVSMIWSGKCRPETSPRTSIKVEAQSVEAEANLVIPSRVLREAKDEGKAAADFELISQLGEGGMGVVHAARQASIDRTVALKMLKPAGAEDAEARGKFLSEAVVTGDLEHPNIVPIYDVGKSEAGALFYAMKRVKGTPWEAVLSEKTFPENLEILMKVADAVALAHSRGVVHRDLKPENVMLGDFGEVLLMDWGLALSSGRSSRSTGMGGTPAYMAPEMAAGPVERIGFGSDIYLLGAILFEIITGKAPHTGKNVMQCLFAAARNEIQSTEKSGELIDIALRAMATDPEERYANVGAFQEAIRQYQSHSESISLSTRAEEDLEAAKEKDHYETFARSLFGFQEAVSLWDGNARAQRGVSEAGVAYATSALGKGDYDLGASLLDPDNSEHAELAQQIQDAQHERDARQQRLKTFKRIGAGLVVIVFLIISVAFFWIRAEQQLTQQERDKAVAARKVADQKTDEAQEQRDKAEEQKKIAVAQKVIADEKTIEAQEQRDEAEEQKGIAVAQKVIANEKTIEAQEQRDKAEEQKEIADAKTIEATRQRELAVEAQKKEEYRAYVATIGLAAAKIEENAFDRAFALLEQCPQHLRDWEWGRLRFLCTQDIRAFDAQQPLEAVAFSPDGRRFVGGGWGGTAHIWGTDSGEELLGIPTGGQYVYSVAFSPDGKQVATGTNDRPNYVKIWNAETGALVQELPGHGDAVLSVAYSRDGKRLLTGSYDNTARLWDLETGRSRVLAGHDWWVWSAAFSADEKRIVTASQDGSVIVWSVEPGENGETDVDGIKVTAGPPFLGHVGQVYAAVFSPDGKSVASAGYDKRVLLWNPDEVESFDFDTLLSEEESRPPQFRALDGHTAGVRSVCFSDDGKLLLTGSYDNTVRVWDVGTRKMLKTLRGHAGRVWSCAFAPDGESVLSASHDHQAKLWSIAGYEEVRVFRGRVLEGHQDAILGAAFSPDGSRIVTASRDRTAKTWDFSTGEEIREFKEGHDFLASTAVFFPDGKRVLTAAVDNTARIWDVATGTELLSLEGTGPSAAVTLSHDAKSILTGSADKTARLWDAEKGSLLRTLEGHRSEVTAVAFSPDDTLLLTGDSGGRCRLWSAATGEVVWEADSHSRGITAVAFLPDGKRVLTASLDNSVGQWDVGTGREELSLILKHPDAVTSMAISPDGRYALTACTDRITRLWDTSVARLVRELPTGEEMVNRVAFSPDGRQALTASSDNKVRLWELESGHEVFRAEGENRAFVDLSADEGLVWSAVFSPDGRYLLTVGGNEARLWNLAAGQEVMRLSPHSAVASANFSPDGKHIVTGSWDNSARIWNAETGLGERKLERGHTRFVNSAIFSPDGTKVLTASDDNSVRTWDANTGELLPTAFVGHEDRVRSVEFSSDGKRVLTASNDKTARIWDAETGQPLSVLTGHGQAVLDAAFATDASRVITASEDNTAKIWDAETGEEILSLEGHTASVTSVAFSPDGRRVATGSQDNTAKTWDALTGDEFLTLKGHSQEVTSIAFSPDGRSVLTGSLDGTLILWLASDWRAEKPPIESQIGVISPPH
ncbi:MAG: protein kinase [Planctomycetes bacterium]|nr:protein kinase [Planctomycetota bacterium]